MSLLNKQEIGKRLEAERLKTNKTRRRFAEDAGVDQSQYSKIEKGILPITESIMRKLSNSYGLNQDSILFGTNVPRETVFSGQAVDQVGLYDTKESILRMLEKSLDANARHAAANEKNTDNLTRLVDILALNLNLDETDPVSPPSQEEGAKKRGPVLQTGVFVGKKEIVYGQRKREKKKGSSF